MKKIIVLVAALLCAGCASTGNYANGDYARNCGMAMDELTLCNGYVSPHEF
ncbi:hypothetical protein [Mesorhizobium sp.]|uniref:hypothetical protein n=1 Tax=Mesorhizobium sp. TaxID=1871066 RepID=UPI0025C6D4C7|nr:hypothetical protein [Mesorhizobium sp.]